MSGTHRRGRPLLLAACLLTLVPVAAAQANVPSPVTRTMPIAVPSMGGWSAGTATFAVTFNDAGGSATASAPSVALGAGQVLRIDTCIRARIVTGARSTTCQQKTVDTRGNTAAIKVTAPSVTASFKRPAAGGSGYVAAIVAVAQRKSDGNWTPIASSWPAAGLKSAAVALAPVGAATGAIPASEGLPLSSAPTGGVDNGQPDSFCAPVTREAGTPPGPGVTAGALGTDAPAYNEVGEPSGAYAGQAPKGVMILINGGGWYSVGPGAVEAMRGDADRWRARGWRTVSITYRGCDQAVNDVLWAYDRARARYGTALPFCLSGASAGGHLALLAAWARPDAACAIDEGGPVDAATLAGQRAWSATDPTGQSDGPHWVYNLMTAAWGVDQLPWYSPALFKINARVLVGVAAHDPFVPYAQATELRDRLKARNPLAYVDTVQLAAGDASWVHAAVSQAAIDDFSRRELALVAPLAQG